MENRTLLRLKKKLMYTRRLKFVVALLGILFLVFLANWWMLSSIPHVTVSLKSTLVSSHLSTHQVMWEKNHKGKLFQNYIYGRLLALAARSLSKNNPEPKDLWHEPHAVEWTPCAYKRNWNPSDEAFVLIFLYTPEGSNGYIMVSANGGINQQRIAVCNAVVIARLLNSTLIIPMFLYSSVWKDVSQFGDIYQEDHFISYLKPDIPVVRELPVELRSLDLYATGSVLTDADITKEAKPSFYLKNVLPIIHRNKVVHFLGFGNRLAFDPMPFELQRLRCRCNFHALKYVPKIQKIGALLLRRMRKQSYSGPLDRYLAGPHAEPSRRAEDLHPKESSRFLSLHLRFEIDMIAHSLCDFGGGGEERLELERYREIHFPALAHLGNDSRLPSPKTLRSEGLCPLTPEEAVLMLAALGFDRGTNIFVAGSHIYGGKTRLAALTGLYPNLVTKETLLSFSEIAAFRNFSSQLAALDFIGCTGSDMFVMTDAGSQFSSLVSGHRIYYGDGRMPTIRPNKRRMAAIFSRNATIGWGVFEERMRKAVRQTKIPKPRPAFRSIYRIPRCRECMCKSSKSCSSRSSTFQF